MLSIGPFDDRVVDMGRDVAVLTAHKCTPSHHPLSAAPTNVVKNRGSATLPHTPNLFGITPRKTGFNIRN